MLPTPTNFINAIYIVRNGKILDSIHGQICIFQRWNSAPVRWNWTHKELVEGVKPAWNARRETNQKYQQLLVAPELSNVGQKVVKV